MFYKTAILKNFTGKHLCWSLFFVGLHASNCIKKGLQHRYILVNIRKFTRTSILKNKKQPPEVFCKKMCSSKFHKFTENTCARVFFKIKLPTLTCNFINKETLAQVFSCKFCEFSKNTFFTEHERRGEGGSE